MTCRRQLRPPVALAAGALGLGLLAGCGADTSPGGTSVDQTADIDPTAATTGTTEASPTQTQAATDRGAGDVLTAEDDGATLRLAPGEQASLQLAPPWQDALPEVDDSSVVELVPVDHFADPGYAEMEVHAVGAGAATVTVSAPDGGRLEVHVEVDG